LQPIKPNGIPLHVSSEIKGFSAALSPVYPQDVNSLSNFIGNVARKKYVLLVLRLQISREQNLSWRLIKYGRRLFYGRTCRLRS